MRDRFFVFFHQAFTEYVTLPKLDEDQAMIIYGDVMIQMAFILLPVMLIAVVAGIAGKLISIRFASYC